MTERAYCRVYYTVKDDPKFETIYTDDHHLATWLRLLIAADAIWPASADLPAAARKASVSALVAAGLVDLLPSGRYRIHGLDAERGSRRDAARASVAQRTYNGRSTNVSESGYSRSEPSLDRAEPSRDNARVDGDEGELFALIAKGGAFIRPDSPLGIRLLGLVDRRGAKVVLEEARKLTPPMSDRQWVLGLENRLERIPTGTDARADDLDDERAKRNERVQRDMWKRRVEVYRHTGQWDEAWGAPPEAVA